MKTFLLFLTLAIVFVSCKKNEETITINSANSYISAKVDGTLINYSSATVLKQTVGDIQQIHVAGTIGSPATQTINIQVTKTGGISTGTYNESNAMILMGSTTNAYSTSATTNVTVTAIDATHIEGTFSGTADEISGNGGASKAITEGKFNVKF